MDEGTVIPFPLQRRVQAAGSPAGATWAEPTPAEETPVAGEAFAFLSLEIRRMARNGSFIEGGVAGRILNRCVLSALEVVSKEGAPVDLSGTVLRPVIEAAFSGPVGPVRAATTGLAVRDAVRRVQREAEVEFYVFGSITGGTTSEVEPGVRFVSGSPRQTAARFREHAAPGQILLADDVWQACRDVVVTSGAPVLVTIPGSEPVSSRALISLR